MGLSELLIPPRGALAEVHRGSVRTSFREVVAELVNLLGKKLTAAIAGVKDVRAVDRWLEGKAAYGDKESRLRYAHLAASLLARSDSAEVVRVWFLSVNPELDDRSPLVVLREGEAETAGRRVLDAARIFVLHG